MPSFHPLVSASFGIVVILSSVGTAQAQTAQAQTESSTDRSPNPPSTPTKTTKADPPLVFADRSLSPDATEGEASTEIQAQADPAAPESSDEAPSELEDIVPDLAPQEPSEASPEAPTEAGTAETEEVTPAADRALEEVLSPPAPAYLDADPNPLQFPTRPEEVEIVGSQPITLEQAFELARRNSQELQRAQLQLENARAQLREARSADLPNLAAGATFNVQQGQERVVQSVTPQGFPTTTTTRDTFDPSINGTLELSYDLFTSGQRSAQIRASEEQVRFQELQVEVTDEELRLNVAQDYYNLQQSDEEVRIARDSVSQNEQSLRDAEALERAGVGTRFDVLQSQVDLANAQQELTNALSTQEVSRRRLVDRLDLAQSVEVTAADPVEVAGLWNLSLEESIVQSYRNRAELEQQLSTREQAVQRRRAALGSLGPQISLFANYQAAAALNVDDSLDDDYSFGARLQINLFDGGAARARADQEEANIATAESDFAQNRSQIRLQVEEAYSSLQANFSNIQTTALAVEQAREALRLARLRFQAGVGTQTDVLRSQTELTQADVNRVRAILDYNRALVQLQRFVSNLPDGDLSDVVP